MSLCHQCGQPVRREAIPIRLMRNQGIMFVSEWGEYPSPGQTYGVVCSIRCLNAWKRGEPAGAPHPFIGFDMLADPPEPEPRWPDWLARWHPDVVEVSTAFKETWTGPRNRREGWLNRIKAWWQKPPGREEWP